ncbi:MAG TPA: dTDP-4-dehydrorhamnose reductase [Terriglobia bacterium]|nr:dTDP-4-dehydrorhamnose reductase [Terriglobia bacterium]
MKVLLIGALGQLGSDLPRVLRADTLVPLSHSDIEITDPTSVRRAFEQHRPEVVINTAAFHRVDDCETEIERAFQVNAFAVRTLAQACRQCSAVLVHFSTDYVFDGEKTEPYAETDSPRPLSVYGASKLAGEYLLEATLDRHFLVRTCGLYGAGGSRSKGGNFVETMLRLAAHGKPIRVVSDQVVTPTYTADLARKVGQLITSEAYGLYHITNGGACSWFEFAGAIFELAGVEADLHPISSAAFGAAARRPAYSVMRHRRLESLGLDDLPAWQDGLRRYFAQRHEVSERNTAGRHAGTELRP